jgi:F-box/WD-40 domain protein 2
MSELAKPFPAWLEGVVKHFSSLSSDEQTVTLNQLIACCGSEQLWHLQQKLPDFLYRDFVSLLPPELTEKILSYLPPASLLSCCKVSRLWRDRVNCMQQLWLVQARRVGCNTSLLETQPAALETQDWKHSCVEALRLRNLLDCGKAWNQEGLVNLVRPPGRFSALNHHLGHIAGGTADSSPHTQDTESSESVVIWSVLASRVTVSFPVSGSVSCIKLHYPSLVVCGHFDGTLSSHCVSGEDRGQPPGSLLHKFRMHTAPVLALDLAISEDLLVSGSADCSTKLWQLSTGQLLRTLSNQSHWVLSVILCPLTRHQVPRFSGRHLLLTMTRDDIQLWTWVDPLSPASPHLAQPDLYIPLKSVTEAIQSFFFTPGLHFDGSKISFIRQMPMFDTQTIGDADIVILDANTGKVVHNVHVNQKIRKLLAIGSRYAVLLLPFVDNKYKNLAVVDLVRREIVGGATVPHSRASTPDFSQVSLGDAGWLDGLNGEVTTGLVACLALADSSIQIVTWDRRQDQELVTCREPGKHGLFVTGSSW